MKRFLSFASLLVAAAVAGTLPVDVFAATPHLHDAVVGALLIAPAPVAVPQGTLARIKESLKAMFAPGTADADIDAALAGEVSETTPAATPSVTTTSPSDLAAQIQAALAPLQQQVQGLTSALESEKSARATAQQALEAQQATERTAKITKALDDAIAAGKIEAAKRETWQKRYEKDFDGTAEIIAETASRTQGKAADAKTTQQAAGDAPKPGSMAASVRPDVLAYVTATQATA